jgi:hypothetical protein
MTRCTRRSCTAAYRPEPYVRAGTAIRPGPNSPLSSSGYAAMGSRTEARRTPCARSSRPLYRQPECPFDIVVDSICRIRSRVTP